MGEDQRFDENEAMNQDSLLDSPPMHVHEFLGSVKQSENSAGKHNHRFAGVTSEVILIAGGGHKHAFMVNTYFFDHHHEVAVETGPAIDVGDGKHVHFAMGKTTVSEGHHHNFQFATLIDSLLMTL